MFVRLSFELVGAAWTCMVLLFVLVGATKQYFVVEDPSLKAPEGTPPSATMLCSVASNIRNKHYFPK